MTIVEGHNITNSGLVLNLDAINAKSYISNKFIAYGKVGLGSASDNDVQFQVNGTGVFKRLGHGQIFDNYVIKPEDVVYKYNFDIDGCHYHGSSFQVPPSAYITFSFDYYISPGATFTGSNLLAAFENYGGSGTYAFPSLPNSNTGVWQRVTVTSGPLAGYGTQAVFLYPGGCGGTRMCTSGFILFRNPKVELISTDSGTSNFKHTQSNNDLSRWYDLTGNSTATIYNSPLYDPLTGGGLSFYGSDKYITIPENSLFNTNTPSVEVWVKTNNLSQNGHFFEKGQVNTQYSLFQEGGSLIWRKNTSNGLSSHLINATNLSTSKYVHVVATYTSGSSKIYINGNLISTNTSGTGTITTNANGSSIGVYGGENGSRGYWYDGKIGLVRVYNKELSETEVKQNFESSRGRFGV